MNIDINQNYWLTVEPYVYINFTQNSVLLYNTLDAAYTESTNPLIVELMRQICVKENCGVCLLTSKNLTNDDVRSFIIDIREKFIGDILPVALSEGRPVQLISLLNFQQDKMRLNDDKMKENIEPSISIGENILENLHEVNLFFEEKNDLGIEVYSDILIQMENVPRINLCGEFLKYPQLPLLVNFLSKTQGNKAIVTDYQDINVNDILTANLDEGYSFQVNVDFPLDNKKQWDSLITLISSSKRKIKFVFGIKNEADIDEVEKMIIDYKIEDYQFSPIYNSQNIDFFKDNVFLTKDDIFSTPLSMKEIFANQTLNTYNFGRIFIKSNGDVLTKKNTKPIGNIKKDTIKKIIFDEISEGNSWLEIRNQQPCSNCLYQWLCPSPSEYEKAINKPNLCHVEP
ncbi:TIGR04150 pseudo-rSAM protein [Capnocytophaga felis]|uniref:TIGR04150 pseudo-rSAM protein n=1 Tax=Capnocytophaga felis TaxID=2267611 RepID=A0A5M4BBS2_9FLAO|nr:TIGR04150 pseudo-rSAM protein [Capnocytophaga felis]GET47033.1 hypothetical protein RCZ01_23350 [Capnocytophaga felis]GET49584.1 hypothetical protein RCZ02_24150 [Capnocytophaga felis]